MDYFRAIGSAAVHTLVQKSGINTPWTLGAKVTAYEGESIWTLYDGTKRDDGTLVSIFEFDGSSPNKRNALPLAKNALRKLRTTRHPDVLKFMDVIETETTVHIMTERVKPLSSEVRAWSPSAIKEQQEWLLWGLHRLSIALAFVNESANATHGNVRLSSVFLSTSGEWRLGGFEVLSNPTDPAAVLYTHASTLPDAYSISPPEVKKGGWSTLKENSPAAADSYALALLIHALFNPTAGPPPTTQPPHQPPQASSRGSIPTAVFPSFKKLLNPNPRTRLNAKGFLDIGLSESVSEGGFFKSNRLIKICESLGNFGLMSDGERAQLIRTVSEVAPTLPATFATRLVLPSLLGSLELPAMAHQASAIIPVSILLGKNVPSEDYNKIVLEPIIKLFASSDRGTRMALLDALPEFAPKLDKKLVSDKIWPHLQTGFSDTVAVIREATVKSIGLLSDKFTERILNNDLLRHLARLQSDPESSIRTNTCILIGRLGPTLGYNSKRKVLVMAFAKALKDDFVHARVAGLMAFMACIDCFDIEELAGRVVGVVAGALVDKEKLVRDQAFKAIELFMKKIEAHAATMPETVPNDTGASMLGLPTPNGQTGLTNTAAGAASSLASWAISSLSSSGAKLAPSEIQSSIASSSMSGHPTAPPPLPSSSTKPVAPAVPTASKPKGMQLGAHRQAKHNMPGGLASELDAWGKDDLIDLDADEADWNAFEEAPASNLPVNAVALGFEDVGPADGDEDPWGDMDDAAAGPATPKSPLPHIAPSPSYPSLSTQPRKPAAPKSIVPSRATTLSPQTVSTMSSARSSPVHESSESAATTPISTAGMTREEKAAEMARRKEERKQRIAALKEQKKVGGK
ncbi:ARM repeat-containing protein [Peniophora sp. CONT]|nr:ARM repeat-containing protein [Peniophora sp. CONT]